MNEIQISKLYFSKNKTGFTIPYLIGFEYYNSKNLMTISDFFTMILESTSETIYYLHYCPDIGEYVISKSHPTFKMKGVEILNNQRKTKLILTQSIEVLGNELDTVVKKLGSILFIMGKYKNIIFVYAKFSRNIFHSIRFSRALVC